MANGQNIDYSEKRKRPKGFICPCTGVKYHNIQTCLLVYAADSGERLQDHWSSSSACETVIVLNSFVFDPDIIISLFSEKLVMGLPILLDRLSNASKLH